MAPLAATDAIIPVEPRYLETIGLMSALQKINSIREGWPHSNLSQRSTSTVEHLLADEVRWGTGPREASMRVRKNVG
jgi:hypothetical protein